MGNPAYRESKTLPFIPNLNPLNTIMEDKDIIVLEIEERAWHIVYQKHTTQPSSKSYIKDSRHLPIQHRYG